MDMKSVITTIGKANPKYKRSQCETAELLITKMNLNPVQKRILKSIYKATGIESRYSVLNDYHHASEEVNFYPSDPHVDFPSTAARMKLYKENALDLALSAVQNALSYLNSFQLNQITHLITVSCTGMYAPGVDIELVTTLNLNPTVQRTCINFMGCYGAFNAIKVADHICKADSTATVLIVSVEICTIHFQKNMNMDNMIANSIFADGAAAIIVQSQSRQNKCFTIESFHCDLLPHESKAMTWSIADNGFDIVLSSYVPDIIKSAMPLFMNNLLNQSCLSFSDINYYAIHPGGLKILEACEKELNITKDQNKYAYEILRNYGNMSSATVLFVLKAIWDNMQNESHDKNIFSCAFGPGLTLESMLLKSHIQL